MSPFEWSESAIGGQGMSRRGSALVISGEPRTAVAVTLVLQEMDLAVDLGYEATFAARWIRHARYDVVVLGALDAATPSTPSSWRTSAGSRPRHASSSSATTRGQRARRSAWAWKSSRSPCR